MQIDLTDPNALTMESVAALIASKDDSQHRQVRVSKNGIAYLSDDVGLANLDGVLFRLETYDAGNDYVGENAAKDEKHVRTVYERIRENWPNPKSEYVDW